MEQHTPSRTVRSRPRRSLRGILFALFLAAGALPLAVADLWLIAAAPRAGMVLETAAIVVAGVLLLVALAWLVSRHLAEAITAPAGRLAAACDEIRRGRPDSWVSTAGAVRDMADLARAFNQMSARLRDRVQRLETAERDSAQLAQEWMKLIEETMKARQPLTGNHPDLLAAYSRAKAHQLAAAGPAVEPMIEGLSEALATAGAADRDERRADDRLAVRNLRVTAPVGARVVDVSGGGMGLETIEQLAAGTGAPFELVEAGRRLEIPGRAVWCRMVRTLRTESGDRVPVYRVGVRFEKAFAVVERERLLELVQAHRRVA